MLGYFEILAYLKFLLLGIRWTVGIRLVAIFGGSVIGVIAALARLSGIKLLEKVASLYVDFYRCTPLIVQLIWIYYALPMLIKYSLDNVTAVSIGLSLYSGSFISEAIRAGILSISKGQTEAAMALGMKQSQVLTRIVLPQAVVRMLPPLGSIFITLVKDSAVASIVGVPELMHQTHYLGSFTLRRMETLTVAAFLYFILTYPLSLGVNHIHHKFSVNR